MQERIANISRVTKETDIVLTLNLDGRGRCVCNTGIGFFDHMIDGLARHGLFDIDLKVSGDLHVDCHHTIEDAGIVFGQAVKEAVGDKKAIKRYGSAILPMDEALVLCAVDLSGRPYLCFDAAFSAPSIGGFDTQMVQEFFYAVSYSALMNVHIKQMSGVNNHHIAECCFKAFAKSLDMATAQDPRIEGVLSTKGTL